MTKFRSTQIPHQTTGGGARRNDESTEQQPRLAEMVERL